MRRCATIAFVLLGLGAQAEASERAASLVNSFEVMCTIEPLDFARLKAKAEAMHLPVRKDIEPAPDANGYFAHSISWLLPLKTGPHELVDSEAHGPNGNVKGCGIGAPDVEAGDIRAQLVSDLHLRRPSAEADAPNGMHITTWLYGKDNEKLILADGSSQKRPGFYLNLLETP
jgi:hypothetical protein